MEERYLVKSAFLDTVFDWNINYSRFKNYYGAESGNPLIMAMSAFSCGLYKEGLDVLNKSYNVNYLETKRNIAEDIEIGVNIKVLEEIKLLDELKLIKFFGPGFN